MSARRERPQHDAASGTLPARQWTTDGEPMREQPPDLFSGTAWYYARYRKRDDLPLSRWRQVIEYLKALYR